MWIFSNNKRWLETWFHGKWINSVWWFIQICLFSENIQDNYVKAFEVKVSWISGNLPKVLNNCPSKHMWTAVYWEKISDWFTFVMLVVDIFLCTDNASEATTEENHWRCFVKKAVYKSFSNFTGKHQSRSLLSIKLQTPRPFFEIKLQILGPVTLLKRDSNAAFFLWNFRNF